MLVRSMGWVWLAVVATARSAGWQKRVSLLVVSRPTFRAGCTRLRRGLFVFISVLIPFLYIFFTGNVLDVGIFYKLGLLYSLTVFHSFERRLRKSEILQPAIWPCVEESTNLILNILKSDIYT